jgi:hypothetical protein
MHCYQSFVSPATGALRPTGGCGRGRSSSSDRMNRGRKRRGHRGSRRERGRPGSGAPSAWRGERFAVERDQAVSSVGRAAEGLEVGLDVRIIRDEDAAPAGRVDGLEIPRWRRYQRWRSNSSLSNVSRASGASRPSRGIRGAWVMPERLRSRWARQSRPWSAAAASMPSASRPPRAAARDFDLSDLSVLAGWRIRSGATAQLARATKENPARAGLSGSGEGGIRTRDGALNPILA